MAKPATIQSQSGASRSTEKNGEHTPAYSSHIRAISLADPPYLLNDFNILELDAFVKNNSESLSVPHRLDQHSIIVVRQGEGRYSVDMKELHCQPGTMIPVAKGKVQIFDPNSEMRGYIILFSESYLYRHVNDLEWFVSLRLFDTQNPVPLIQTSHEIQTELVNLVRLMLSEMRGSALGGQKEILQNLLKVFLIKMTSLNRIDTEPEHRGNGDSDLLYRFRNLLEKNYHSSRCARDYASYLSITPKKLNLISRRYLRQTAKESIDQRVLLEIKRLLAHTDSSIKEIARTTGFDDPTNMIKFFRRYAGETPSEFRTTARQ